MRRMLHAPGCCGTLAAWLNELRPWDGKGDGRLRDPGLSRLIQAYPGLGLSSQAYRRCLLGPLTTPSCNLTVTLPHPLAGHPSLPVTGCLTFFIFRLRRPFVLSSTHRMPTRLPPML